MSNQILEVLKDLSDRRSSIDQAMRDGSMSAKAITEGYAYVYKEGVLGMGRSGSAEVAESGEDHILFTVSTLEEDRDGDVVVPMGCKLHNFVKNPVWFFGHQQWEIPIGTSRGPDGVLHCYPEQQRVRERFYPDTADEDAMFVFGKVQRGILNATSIAFVPLVARRREDVRKGHQHEGGAGGWIFDEWDKTETSIVGVPSNAAATVEQRSLQGALRDALDKEKQFIRPRLQKALQAYCAKSTNESGGCWTGWCPICPSVSKSPNFLDDPKNPLYGKFILDMRRLPRTIKRRADNGKYIAMDGGVFESIDGVVYNNLKEAIAASKSLAKSDAGGWKTGDEAKAKGDVIECPECGYTKWGKTSDNKFACGDCGNYENVPPGVTRVGVNYEKSLAATPVSKSITASDIRVGSIVLLSDDVEGRVVNWNGSNGRMSTDSGMVEFTASDVVRVVRKSLAKGLPAGVSASAQLFHTALTHVGYGLGRPKMSGMDLIYDTPDPEDAEMIAGDIPAIASRAGVTATGRADGRKLIVTLSKSLAKGCDCSAACACKKKGVAKGFEDTVVPVLGEITSTHPKKPGGGYHQSDKQAAMNEARKLGKAKYQELVSQGKIGRGYTISTGFGTDPKVAIAFVSGRGGPTLAKVTIKSAAKLHQGGDNKTLVMATLRSGPHTVEDLASKTALESWELELALKNLVRMGRVVESGGTYRIKSMAKRTTKMSHSTAEAQGLEPVFSPGHQHSERIFYDPGEGKYYDASTDMYLSLSDVSAFGIKSHRRRKGLGESSGAAGGYAVKADDRQLRSQYLDYVAYFRQTNPDQRPLTFEDWMRIPEGDRPGMKKSHRCTFCKGTGSGRRGDCPDCGGRGVVRAKRLVRKAQVRAGQLKPGDVTIDGLGTRNVVVSVERNGNKVVVNYEGRNPYVGTINDLFRNVEQKSIKQRRRTVKSKRYTRKAQSLNAERLRQGMTPDIGTMINTPNGPEAFQDSYEDGGVIVVLTDKGEYKLSGNRLVKKSYNMVSFEEFRGYVIEGLNGLGKNGNAIASSYEQKLRNLWSLGKNPDQALDVLSKVSKQYTRKDFEEVISGEQPPHEMALAQMYQTARASLGAMTPFDPQTGEENKLHKAMSDHCEALKSMWGEHGAKGEDGEAKDLDEVIKDMETSGPGNSETGEANLTDNGIIPEEVESELGDEVEMELGDEVHMDEAEDVEKGVGDDNSFDSDRRPTKLVNHTGTWAIVDERGRVYMTVGSEQEGKAALREEQADWDRKSRTGYAKMDEADDVEKSADDKDEVNIDQRRPHRKSDDVDQLDKDFDEMLEAESDDVEKANPNLCPGCAGYIDLDTGICEDCGYTKSADDGVETKSDFDEEEFTEDDMVQKGDAPIASTKIKRDGDEFVVEAYDADGRRMPNSDYYTDNKEDAQATARAMVNQHKSEDDGVEKSEFDEELEGESPSEVIDDPDVDEILERYVKVLSVQYGAWRIVPKAGEYWITNEDRTDTDGPFENKGEAEQAIRQRVNAGDTGQKSKQYATRKAGRARVRKVLAAGGRIKRGEDGRKWLVLPTVKKSQVQKGATDKNGKPLKVGQSVTLDPGTEYESRGLVEAIVANDIIKVRWLDGGGGTEKITSRSVVGKSIRREVPKSAPPKLLSKARPGETISDFAARHGVDNIGGKWFVLDEHRQKVSTPCDTLDQATKLISSAKQVSKAFDEQVVDWDGLAQLFGNAIAGDIGSRKPAMASRKTTDGRSANIVPIAGNKYSVTFSKSLSSDPVTQSLFADLAKERRLLDLAKTRCGINGN